MNQQKVEREATGLFIIPNTCTVHRETDESARRGDDNVIARVVASRRPER
jgi:hypothetical protein